MNYASTNEPQEPMTLLDAEGMAASVDTYMKSNEYKQKLAERQANMSDSSNAAEVARQAQTPADAAESEPDIDALKSNWRNDPCWDIEDTPGFEAYHDDLLEYRLNIEQQSEQRLIDRAKAVDCSVQTMRFIEMLEGRIRALENKLDKV